MALAVVLLAGACSAPATPTAEPTAVPPTPVPPSPTVPPPAPTRTPVQIGPQVEPSPAGPTPTPFAIPEFPAKGPEDARVVILEFSDFQ